RDSYGIKSLALFGSVARDEARPDSDVDILVEFEHPVGYFTVARLQEHLCILLGRNIDLVIQDAIKQQLRESILKNAIRAA
ncbi:MAG: nucleotidyltransferase family protein, partial [Nitrolancea sp.]